MFPSHTRVFFAVQPTDLRRSFDGLAVTARAVLERDPARGGLFVFSNQRGDQVRVLFRDRHGWCVLAKRLDAGRFDRKRLGAGICRESEASELIRFLEEIIPARVRQNRTAPRSGVLSVVEEIEGACPTVLDIQVNARDTWEEIVAYDKSTTIWPSSLMLCVNVWSLGGTPSGRSPTSVVTPVTRSRT